MNSFSLIHFFLTYTLYFTLSGFDDSTTLLVVFYASLFLIIVFFNQFNKEVMKNNYVIIGYFIMTIEFILFNYLSIWNAKRDTAKLLKDNK